MSFFDSLYIVAGFAMIILLTLTMSYVMPKVMTPLVNAGLPPSANTTIMTKVTQTTNFLDSSFAALFFIFGATSIGLTIFLQSHPVALAFWLIFCIVTILVWDTMVEFITSVEATSLNDHSMDMAISFFKGDMAKAIVVINVLMGAVLFGKRAVGG